MPAEPASPMSRAAARLAGRLRGRLPELRPPRAAPPSPARDLAPRSRGESVLCALERPFLALDRALARVLPDERNPLQHTGAIAISALVVATVTGVLLLIWYRPSVHLAYDSVAALSQAPLTAGLLRSLHRYSSDACMFFALLHALRLCFERRFSGPRWLAWVTGVASLAILWFLGWTGYWLVWDARAKYVAIGTARALDALPIFADPMGRSFLTAAGINSLLFFVVFFVHMLVPLALVFTLWLHLARVARARWLASLPLVVWAVGTLLLLSLAYPATSAEPAHMTARAERFSMDWWFLLPLALSERMSGGALFALFLGGGAVLGSAPWTLSRGRHRPAAIDAARCNACKQCYQDCPYEAISMVPRLDMLRREKYPLQAEVDPARCVACGICVASCDSIGTDLPAFALVEQRGRLEAWIRAATEAGEQARLAFACAHSAGGALAIDPETGACADLPGWRVLVVPCAGWVHAMTLERALRRGAREALVVSCPPGACHYREGPAWLAERLEGVRKPVLRQAHAARERIHVLHLARDRGRALLRAAAGIRAGEAVAGERPVPVALAGLASVALALVVALLVGIPSDLGFAAPAAPGSELVVTFKHPGRREEHCRELSAEERAARPAHMRLERVCDRARADVRLRVRVDGQPRLERAYEPQGIWNDGNSVAVESIPVEPGVHDVEVEIGDSLDPAEWSFATAQRLEFTSDARRVIAFDRLSGFTAH
jgi:coenzyme F420-reducing hydrogenase delta subunit/NAD-dependent dihydropyrimidine dehydrogenase PreA subunit